MGTKERRSRDTPGVTPYFSVPVDGGYHEGFPRLETGDVCSYVGTDLHDEVGVQWRNSYFRRELP